MKTLRIGIVVLGLFVNGAATAEDQKGNTVWDGFSGFLQPDWERDFSATLGVKLWVNEWTRDSFPSSLSDLGNRSEARGKSRTDFRSFEANSGNYLTKMIGNMDRFPTAAVGSS